MVALISFLVIIIFSVIGIKIGAIALKLTGLSQDVASFEAQSAFSGVGFTTSESESIISNPIRRRIIRILMLIGSAGLTTSIATLVLTFVGESGVGTLKRLIGLIIGLVILFFIFRLKLIDKIITRFFEKILRKYTKLRIYDYEKLLGLSQGFSIAKFKIKKLSWMANKKLKDSKPDYEGILVIGVIRNIDGKDIFLGVPKADTLIKAGDNIICYGRDDSLTALALRIKGVKGERERKKAIKKEYKFKTTAQIQSIVKK